MNLSALRSLLSQRSRLLSLLIAAVASLSFTSAHAQVFRNPARIPTTGDPSWVTVADLNGDGVPDILYGNVNTSPHEVDALLSQSSGGYSPSKLVQSNGISCRTADVNRDGKADLICLNLLDAYDFSVTTWLGNGDGTFQLGITSGAVSDPNGIYAIWLPAPADVNGDGIPDLVIGVFDESGLTGNGSTIFVLLGNGMGSFSVSSHVSVPSGPPIWDFTTMDVNGDGKADLVEPIGPWVFLGNGDGSFQAGVPQGAFDHCTFHDMDGDGHPDAVCGAILNTSGNTGGGDTSGTTELAILHGNTDGTFSKTPIYTKTFGNPTGGYGLFLYPQFLADENGDGILDLLASSKDGLAVLPGQPGLKFGDPTHYSVGFLGFAYQMSTAYSDMNGDGVIDIVSTGPNGIYISYGKGDGTFAAPAAVPVALEVGFAALADFNGDGIPDLVATGDGNLNLSFGNGDGTFKAYTTVNSGAVQFPNYQVMHGDFLGNGKQDLLAIGGMPQGTGQYSNFGFYLAEGNGDGTFAVPQLITNPPLPSSLVSPIEIADVNKDGRDDIITSDRQSLTVGLSNGDGTFKTVTSAIPGQTVGPAHTPVVFADFNGDGKLDAAYGDSGSVYVLSGNGDGSFNGAGTALPVPDVQGQNPNEIFSVAIADFDGDGKIDVAALVEYAPDAIGAYSVPTEKPIITAVLIYYGNGDGTFSSPAVAGTFKQPYVHLYAADVNHDGRPDLILQTEGVIGGYTDVQGDAIGVLPYQGARLFGPEQNYTGGLQINFPMGIADLNHDGYPDLVAVNGGSTSLPGNGVTPLVNVGPQLPNTGKQSVTSLTTSNSSVVAGSAVTFTATVTTSASGEPAPTGSVRFVDQTGISVSVPLTAVNSTTAIATFSTSSIGIGQDTVGAFYSADTNFAPSSAEIAESVNGYPAALTIISSKNPTLNLPNVSLTITATNSGSGAMAIPTGSVNITDGTTPLAGPLVLNAGSTTYNASLNYPGAHNLTVWYSGDALHNSATTSLTQTVLQTPSVSISFSSATINVNQSVTAIVTVSPSVGPTPTGTITLAGGGYTSTAVPLNNGTATVAIGADALAVGSDTFTATYTPDAAGSSAYVGASGSQFINVAPVPPSFSLTGTSVTVALGATTGNTSTITVTPASGFTGSVTLTASTTSSPANATYAPTLTLIGNPVNITGVGAGSATLRVSTQGGASALLSPPFPGMLRWTGTGGAALACVLLVGCPARRRIWRGVLGAIATAGLMVCGLSACAGGGNGGGSTGGGSNSSPVTTAGTYTVTINGSSGQLTASTTVTVVVQ